MDIIFSYLRLLSSWASVTIIAGCIGTLLVYISFIVVQQLLSRHGRQQLHHLRHYTSVDVKPYVVGFFHPYCNAGGGGERVLWTAIRALQKRHTHVRCVVYTGDTDVTPDDILQKAQNNFNITLPRTDRHSLAFVYLNRRRWVEAARYPVFTLLGQSLGSIVLGFEALWKFVPDLYIDTMGYAFTMPLFKYLGQCNVACYVHYPTISTDMLENVTTRRESYNNQSFISRSVVLSSLKMVYYRLFAYAYSVAGRSSQVIMVNSTWTRNHILQLWQAPDRTFRIYPPCDIKEFVKLPLGKTAVPKLIVSVSQFRPEKDHTLQIRTFSTFLSHLPDAERSKYRLVLIGSCRNEEDEQLVDKLRRLCKIHQIEDFVDFKLNFSFSSLKHILAEATVGIHTMWNEHFGISVVELMASGVITLAHNSGGPRLDIVVDYENQATGFLADSVETYSQALKDIFELSPDKITQIQMAARKSAERFTEDKFEIGFVVALESLIG